MTAKNSVLPKCNDQRRSVRLHLTNVTGLGAVRLLQSLLPSLVTLPNCKLEEVYLPARGEISNFTLFEKDTSRFIYKRYLPNAISRLLECTVFGSKFDGENSILVFGDIPLRCKSRQTVFLQTSLLIPGASTGRQLGGFKYWVARRLFRRNIKYVSNFIVQTEAMKTSLSEFYPETRGRIHIITQPAPSWLAESGLKSTRFNSKIDTGLRLFYPAAYYPHKNHQILSEINQSNTWPVSELTLTIPDNENPNRTIPWIRCVDKIEPVEVLSLYGTADSLLFLSLSESLGFPLVEAMWLGLPIICPDLPYARALCGEQAIYFEANNVKSLEAAVEELNKLRKSDWWPDWEEQLSNIPKDWDTVAGMMIDVVCGRMSNSNS